MALLPEHDDNHKQQPQLLYRQKATQQQMWNQQLYQQQWASEQQYSNNVNDYDDQLDEVIIMQLMMCGYERNDIIEAIRCVKDPNDTLKIRDKLDETIQRNNQAQWDLTKPKTSGSNYIHSDVSTGFEHLEESESIPISYISNKFEYLDQSEASYTLNTLEIIANLHINNKPSISLINNTLSITSKYKNEIFLGIRNILPNITRYKSVIKQIDSIQFNVENTNKIINILNKKIKYIKK
eukprot:228112_1